MEYNINMNDFTQNLNLFMKEKNITQTRLSEILNVSQQTVSKYINGKIEPGIETVIKIARFFEVTVDCLLGLED